MSAMTEPQHCGESKNVTVFHCFAYQSTKELLENVEKYASAFFHHQSFASLSLENAILMCHHLNPTSYVIFSAIKW